MNSEYQTIIFDFDYTLADSSRGIADCINYALAELDLPRVPVEAAHRTIGMHLNDAFVQLAGEHHAAHRDEFRRHFSVRSDQVMNDMIILYDTAPQALQKLKEHGKQLGIVSTKNRSRISAFLQRENLLDFFDIIVGGEDVACHKPDPEGLHQAVLRLNSRLHQTLYVGDSVVDAKAAQRAGVSFVAVLSGVTLRDEFYSYPAAAVVDDLGQLVDWLIPNIFIGANSNA